MEECRPVASPDDDCRTIPGNGASGMDEIATSGGHCTMFDLPPVFNIFSMQHPATDF